MSKKILIAIIAIVAVVAIVVAVSLSESGPKEQQQENKPAEQEKVEATPEALDKLILSTIEQWKKTCADFLAGDIRDESDCPGFDNPTVKDLCYYCFAVKNQSPTLCEKIIYDGAKAVCQKATGSTIDEIVK